MTSTDRVLLGLAFKWGLFLFWPVIASLLLFSAAIVCACAWLAIPFGTTTWEDGGCSLKFPWSKS